MFFFLTFGLTSFSTVCDRETLLGAGKRVINFHKETDKAFYVQVSTFTSGKGHLPAALRPLCLKGPATAGCSLLKSSSVCFVCSCLIWCKILKFFYEVTIVFSLCPLSLSLCSIFFLTHSSSLCFSFSLFVSVCLSALSLSRSLFLPCFSLFSLSLSLLSLIRSLSLCNSVFSSSKLEPFARSGSRVWGSVRLCFVCVCLCMAVDGYC